MERLVYLIPPEDAGKSVGWLARKRLGISASLLRRVKRLDGGITLDGETVFTDKIVSSGQVMSVSRGEEGTTPGLICEHGDVNIPYEDELMLIADKPGGIAVHPSPGNPSGTLANFIAGYLEDEGEPPGKFHAINRLDKGTSGLLCLARDRYAAAVLERALAAGNICREYIAVCDGEPPEREGTVDLPIGRAEGYGIRRTVDFKSGRPAVTHYEVLEKGKGGSLLRLRLETGRTHQIRVHMAALGCPLRGDFMYGREIEGFPRVALHCWKIMLRLPDRFVSVSTPAPTYFDSLLNGEE